MGDEPTVLSLDARLSIVEQRLGIDPAAIVADQANSAAAGADAHVGNVQSDVPPPAVPDSPEDALAAANTADDEQQALDHVNRALERWPEDEDLLAAKAELEKDLAASNADAGNAGEPSV